MRVFFKNFQGIRNTWTELFQEAADFASTLPPDRLISISPSASGRGTPGIVTVWYWDEGEPCPHCGNKLTGNESGVCPECGTEVEKP